MELFFKVWIDPRGVTNRAVKVESDKGRDGVLFLIAYIAAVLTTFTSFTWEEPVSFLFVAVVAIIAGVVVAPLSLYLYPLLIKWIGSWFEGKANTFELRVAVVYSSIVPNILISLLSLPFIVMIGEIYFLENSDMYSFTQPAVNLWGAWVLLFLSLGLGIWVFVIQLHAIGEVHGFSAWKALLVQFLLGLMLFFILVVVLLFILILL
ncbi:hypothetical protein JCM19046_2214 [Bacillus sp. JCM 19046]|nr:hypothetical protein JCM19045_3584 [Bacillus sp. JCM 19045]GAF17689.1 hypothetical protein JCM19046_2214 [Bacillus sp. JCM 19046]